MRKDEDGNEYPETLGEYRDLCIALGGDGNRAVMFLDRKIAAQGRNAIVIVPDVSMRTLLFPMLGK